MRYSSNTSTTNIKDLLVMAFAILTISCGEKDSESVDVKPKENSVENHPTTKKSDQALFDATLLGEAEKIKRAFADGADVNTKGAFHAAVVASLDSGDNQIVEMFITNGADVNAKHDGLTPIDAINLLSDVATVSKKLRASLGKTDDGIPIADLLRKHGAKTSEELKAEAE
jgi:hypothetical protein